MYKIAKFLVIGAIVATGVVSSTSGVSAQQECKINPVKEGYLTLNQTSRADSNTKLNGNTITTNVIVTGDADCTKNLSIGVWQWPTENGLPLSSQVLYKTVTKSFGPGEHTVSIDVPACKWQADVMEGTRATAADGSADYKIGDPSDPKTDRFLDVAYGGNNVCTTDTPVSTEKSSNSSKSPVTVLPSTGISDSLTAFYSSAITIFTAFSYSIVRKFKNSLK